MLVLRLLVVLLAGFTLFSDEQERFLCNTLQPGCSNVCFDAFAPVSVFRLWLFHLILLCLPHVLFATYVMHKVLSYPYFGGFSCDRSPEGSPFTLENSSSSRELSLRKASLHNLPHEWGVLRFYCSYFLVVILRILLEILFGASQFFLFGLSIPKSFLCYEAPCKSGVECFISRPTEKTVMLNLMLGVATLSILLSVVDLVSSMKAMVRWRRKREMLMEQMCKGEQSSMRTTTTTTEDSEVLLTKRISPGENAKNGFKDEKHANHKKRNDGSSNDKSPGSKDAKVEMSRSHTPMSSPIATHFVLHGHLRAPLCPRPDRGPAPKPRMPTPKLDQYTPGPQHSGQQSDSNESQDKRAWV
ncbi:gap junction delta-4 protein-like [Cottoperca gobio]|uniref:Gap junction protein n=1 Tax=Cottoperca gobio TaxID=56716 RepID=A0A6J2RI34_COTGO|nr:gap junction delta-4 protein-like [Cottoperca gobio]